MNPNEPMIGTGPQYSNATQGPVPTASVAGDETTHNDYPETTAPNPANPQSPDAIPVPKVTREQVAESDEARQEMAIARADHSADVNMPEGVEPDKVNYVPIPLKLDLHLTILVGPRQTQVVSEGFIHRTGPQNRTMPIKAHERVVDLLERMSLPVDGSMVLLIPGTALPFGMEEKPYDGLRDGATVYIVPNVAAEVGPNVPPTRALAAPAPPPRVRELFTPVSMRKPDSSEPDVLVSSEDEKKKAIADGYTVEIPVSK